MIACALAGWLWWRAVVLGDEVHRLRGLLDARPSAAGPAGRASGDAAARRIGGLEKDLEKVRRGIEDRTAIPGSDPTGSGPDTVLRDRVAVEVTAAIKSWLSDRRRESAGRLSRRLTAMTAMNLTNLASVLGLTEEQKSRILKVFESEQAAILAVLEADIDNLEYASRMAEIDLRVSERVREILTVEQLSSEAAKHLPASWLGGLTQRTGAR